MSASSASSSVSLRQEMINRLQTRNRIDAEESLSLLSDNGSRKRVMLLDYAPITSSPDKKVRKSVKGGRTSFDECYYTSSRYVIVTYGK